MPEIGDTGSKKCKVSFWHVDKGEKVTQESPLVEMTTDKAVFDVPAPFTGKLVEVHSLEGAIVNVGDRIAVIEVSE